MQRNGALKLLDEMRDENDDESLRQFLNMFASGQTMLCRVENNLCLHVRFLIRYHCFISYQYHF